MVAYTENFVLKRQFWRRFKVKVACGRNQSYYLAGYLGSGAQIHMMKLYLNVWIARSDELSLFKFGGTHWYWILCFSNPCFSMAGALFSRIFRFG